MMVSYQTYTTRDELPKSLEERLSSVKYFQGHYEMERDYLKVFTKVKKTNPFSVLVFYESPQKKMSLAKRKKLNPYIPEMMLSGIAQYVQFYFIPELREMRLGTYIGSGYRSTQSTYALALARLSERKDISTHILICDQQNAIRLVLSSPRLIVQPHEVVETVDKKIADRILRNKIKAYHLGSKGLIEGIYLVKP